MENYEVTNDVVNEEVTETEATPVEEKQQGFTTAEKAAGIGILACVLYTSYNGGKWIAGKIKKGYNTLKEKAAAKKAAEETAAPVEEQADVAPENGDKKSE